MKREAYRHPKMLDLASRLGIPRSHAIGIMQLLLDYAADVAPQGNIGKWPDGTIAGACEWHGSPAELVDALVDSGWLDRCLVHRLVIHDLAEHAEQWWVLKLAKLKKSFIVATAEATVERSTEASTVPTAEATVERSILLSPSLPSPSLLTIPPNGEVKALDEPKKASNPYTQEFNLWYEKYPKKIAKQDAAAAYPKAIKRIAADKQITNEQAKQYLMEATSVYAASPAGRSGQYTPNPATWLNQGRYDDDRAEWNREQSQPRGQQYTPPPPPTYPQAKPMFTIAQIEEIEENNMRQRMAANANTTR